MGRGMMIKSLFKVLSLWVWVSAAQSCGPGDGGAAARLAEQVMLSEDRKRDVQLLVRHIEEAISTRWPDSRAALYGSSVTGMAHRDSDVDVYLRLRRDASPAPDDRRELTQVQLELAQHSELFSNFYFCNVSLTLTIIKFKHIPSGFNVDLNVKTSEAIVNSQLIGYLLGSGCKQRLVLLLRRWALMHGICGQGLLPNFGLALLVVFYLQQKHILPPISELQKNAIPVFVNNWNMGYDEVALESRIDESLYELLGGFFEFYEDFDFDENIVSTFVAHPVKRQLFQDLRKVPRVFSLYLQNVESNTTMPLDIGSSVCIPEPFQQNINVGAHLDLSPGFRNQIKRAALKYRESDQSAFLDHLMNGVIKKTNVVEYCVMPS